MPGLMIRRLTLKNKDAIVIISKMPEASFSLLK
jgi:hypothetical protein